IMIGPRSALFTPFPNLGLIIIDEEHETSYKSEATPRYHARETAICRARLEDARVVMGSATPSVDAFYQCQKGEFALFRMQTRYGKAMLPKVWIADMREELKQGNRSILSRKLQQKMEEHLERKEQVILFLNRRGYAGYVSCRSCGHVMKCPHCDVSLTAHNNGMLICHYCGYEREQVTRCPSCGSPYIGGFRAGTQQIEQMIKKTFPEKRILRMDGDTTRSKDSYDEILGTFSKGEADILIGTQMIVKGHDFPNVTLMGVLLADLSLNADSYRAGERTFQLLTQAVGRAGRGAKEGTAVIQTYHPEHYSITAAVSQDYEAFYREEMEYRQLLGYPPAANLMAIHGAGEKEEHLMEAMEYVRRFLIRINRSDQVQMIGPAKESVARISDLYRMVLYVKAADRELLLRLREKLEQYIEINKGFQSVYIQYDFNA
ncbi:MAG: primosomal protein N', partial [Fusicatenibacter sp.]